MYPGSRLFLVAAFLCGFGLATAANAKDWTVMVGGEMSSGGGYYGGGTMTPILTFQPSNLTINAGDTVTFSSLGGAAHNVHADDNSFRCANGCDGAGGNGNPASNDWVSTVTFSKAGVVNFHCDVHASMGMTGSITVNAVATGQPISAATSGAWYNTQQSGHGFLIEVLPNNVFLAVWFVFTPSGSAQAQSWVYAQGNYDPTSNTVTMSGSGVFIEGGTMFPPNFDHNSLTRTNWGSITFTFTDCNNGMVTWNSGMPGYGSGSLAITRLSGLAGLTCQ